MARSLAAHLDVRMLAPTTKPIDPLVARTFEEQAISLTPVGVAARGVSSEAGRLMRSYAGGVPYVMYGRHHHAALHDAVAEQLRRGTDALLLDHLDAWQYAPRGWSGGVTVDLHNVYSLLAARVASESSWAKSLLLRQQARSLARMERACCEGADLVFAVSQDEAAHFRDLAGTRGADVVTIPNGADTSSLQDLPTGRLSGAARILFVGTMSWAPNIEAARFLAEEVLPAVQRRVPAELYIVGRDPSDAVRALSRAKGVHVTGKVADVRPYLLDSALLAVPLTAGGGTRLKILEAFAAGLPVVTTVVGGEGIAATADVHWLVAERGPAFVDAVVETLAHRQRAADRAVLARRLVTDEYDWHRLGERAAVAITRVATRKQRP